MKTSMNVQEIHVILMLLVPIQLAATHATANMDLYHGKHKVQVCL